MKGTLLKSLMLCSLGFMILENVQANAARDALKRFKKSVNAQQHDRNQGLDTLVSQLSVVRANEEEASNRLQTLRQARPIAREEESVLMQGIAEVDKLRAQTTSLIADLPRHTSNMNNSIQRLSALSTRDQMANLYYNISMFAADLQRTAHLNGLINPKHGKNETKIVLADLVRVSADVENLVKQLESDCAAVVRLSTSVDEATEKRLREHLEVAYGLEQAIGGYLFRANQYAKNHKNNDECKIGCSLRTGLAELMKRTADQSSALKRACIANGIEVLP